MQKEILVTSGVKGLDWPGTWDTTERGFEFQLCILEIVARGFAAKLNDWPEVVKIGSKRRDVLQVTSLFMVMVCYEASMLRYPVG